MFTSKSRNFQLPWSGCLHGTLSAAGEYTPNWNLSLFRGTVGHVTGLLPYVLVGLSLCSWQDNAVGGKKLNSRRCRIGWLLRRVKWLSRRLSPKAIGTQSPP